MNDGRTKISHAVSTEPTSVSLEWHRAWSPEVDEAFAAMPYDPLMDREVIQGLWKLGQRVNPQKVAIIRSFEGQAVGVVPLQKRGFLSWQLLTQYVMPYARFFVLPAYVDVALHALRSEIDCDNVLFYRLPRYRRMLRPEESWVVSIPSSYEELLQQTQYAKKDRQCKKRSAGLTLREDFFEALPTALEFWQKKWLAAGSPATAGRKEDLLLSFSILARQGRLKTFSLYDGDTLAAMEMTMIAQDSLYGMTTIAREEYRSQQPGMRCRLASLEWAATQGVREYDMMRTGGETKKQWAEPQVRGYRLVRSPLGSELLGCALESMKDFLRQRRSRAESLRKAEKP